MSPDHPSAPIAHFESFAEGRGWHASFREPCRQGTASALDEVVPLLLEAEAAAKDGKWVALALSYEAAPAFDPALDVQPPSSFPLAWMAVSMSRQRLSSLWPRIAGFWFLRWSLR